MLDAKADNDIAVWQAGDSGLMRAEITSSGGIIGTATLDTTGKLPSAALANDRPVLAYISGVNNQRSIWLVMPKRTDASTKL